MHSLLLDVPHEAVAGLGADEVRQEKCVEHDALAHHDEETEHGPRLLQLQEREQVHALVFSLFQEGVDPSVIPDFFCLFNIGFYEKHAFFVVLRTKKTEEAEGSLRGGEGRTL